MAVKQSVAKRLAENGALLFDPAKKEEIPLSDPPPAALVDRLRELGVDPLSVGRTIIATWEPNEKIVLEAIRALVSDAEKATLAEIRTALGR